MRAVNTEIDMDAASHIFARDKKRRHSSAASSVAVMSEPVACTLTTKDAARQVTEWSDLATNDDAQPIIELLVGSSPE